jgi:AcrR family transcriptional regulator
MLRVPHGLFRGMNRGMAAKRPLTRQRKRAAPKSVRKRRGEGADRKNEIVAAATLLLVSEGYEGVSMRKVAAAVGISSTALYLYFKEKDELLDTVCHQVFSQIAPALDALLARDDAPIDLLREGLRAYLRFGLANPDQYRVVFLTRRPRDAWDHRAPLSHIDRWGQPRINTFMYLVEGLRRCQEAGQVRQGDLFAMAETVLAAQHGLLALLILSPQQKWSDPEVLIEENVGLILRGLAP